MRKIIITITAICSLSFASYYDVGDIVSDTHQNITKSTCCAVQHVGHQVAVISMKITL